MFYELATSAVFSGSITICIDYSAISFADSTNLALLHYEGGSWIDRTVSLDTTTHTICGSVTSLSPFAVVELPVARVQPPVNADRSSVFSATRGVVPLKFTLTIKGQTTCTLPPATLALTRTAGGTIGAINESVYSSAADSGSSFRISDCQYVYNVNSKALGAGTYRADIRINGRVAGSAVFQLK